MKTLTVLLLGAWILWAGKIDQGELTWTTFELYSKFATYDACTKTIRLVRQHLNGDVGHVMLRCAEEGAEPLPFAER